MAKGLGAFLVDVVIIFVGIFLMITAYSRKEVLLKLVTLGTIRIDPDSPGRTPRAVIFSIGVTLVLVGVLFVILEKLRDLGING